MPNCVAFFVVLCYTTHIYVYFPNKGTFDMSVRINLGEWGSVFAVPSSVVDGHLKIASQNQLKVLLFLLRHSDKDFSYNEIGDTLRIHPDDVADCVSFWVQRGILSEREGELTPSENAAAAVPKAPKASEPETEKPKKRSVISRPQKPDIVSAAQRVASDETLSHVLAEVELALGNPLSSGNIATLVMLYDTCGLPAEVIVMLVNYCVSIGKANMRTIETVGVRWADDGIYTVEAADNRIMLSHQSSKNWSRVSSVFGLKNIGSPTVKQLEFADRWTGEWKFSDDMLRRAYEICVDTKGEMKLGYINGILSKWFKSQIFTLEDIEKTDTKKKKTTAKKSSFDIDELEKID